jgi:hypothetical protein
MDLSAGARSVIVGSLLGDGYLYPNGCLQIEHQLDHGGYVDWKYGMLAEVAGKEPVTIERFDCRTGRTYRSSRFYTKAVLKPYRDVFYRERKKIVPLGIDDLLDPMALAVWFMDDGGRGARTPKGLVFNTSCFSRQEQRRLQAALAERHGVEVSIHEVGRGFQLYVRARSFERFVRQISPYIVPLMRYKLPTDPVTTSPSRGRDGGTVRERTIYYRHNTSALANHRRDEGIV